MNDDWFERWGWIGYRPIHWKGYVVVYAMLLAFVSFAALSIFADGNRYAEIYAWLAFAVGVIGHIFVLLHMKNPG